MESPAHELWPLVREILLDLNNEHWGRPVAVRKLVQLVALPYAGADHHPALGEAIEWAEAQGLVTRQPGFVTLTEAGARRQ